VERETFIIGACLATVEFAAIRVRVNSHLRQNLKINFLVRKVWLDPHEGTGCSLMFRFH